jgi:hypothetical protein
LRRIDCVKHALHLSPKPPIWAPCRRHPSSLTVRP